ncbi:MAG: tetratricopeptide repeat protein [Gemmataceae bacterium]
MALLEVLRIVREVEAPRPSAKLSTIDTLPSVAANRSIEPAKLSRLMKGELDWLVLKALEKDRTRRYETANGLARDIQRYLADEVVEARPPSTGYRLKKFVRRHKGQVLAVAAVAAAILVGAGIAVWQARVARAAERDAVAAGVREAEQRVEAETKEAVARDAEAATKEVLKFVQTKVFAAAGPRGRAGGLGKDVKLREALDAAERSIPENFANRPLVELEIREVLIKTYHHLGDYEASRRQLALWLDVCERKLNRIHPRYPGFLESVVKSGNFNLDQASLSAQLRRVEDAYQHYLNVLGPDDPGTLKLLLIRASFIARQPDRRSEAMRLVEDATARIRGKYPSESRQALELDSAAASVRYLAQPSNDAIQQQEAALERMRGVVPPDDPMILATLSNLGLSYLNAKRYPEAIRHFEESFALQKRQVGGADQSLDARLRGLAIAYSSAGRDEDAVKLLETYLPRLADQLGTGHHEVLASAINLTNSLNILKRYEDTIRVTDPYLRAGVEKYGPDHATIRLLKGNLLFAYLELERPEAEALLRDLGDMAARDSKTGDRAIKALLAEQLQYHAGMKPGQKAVLLRAAIDVFDQKRTEPGWWHGPETLAQARCVTQHNLAVVYLDDGQVELARPILQANLADLRSVYPANSVQLAEALRATGELFQRVKDFSTAESLIRESLALSERLQPGTVEVIVKRFSLGQVLVGLKHYDAAEKEYLAVMEWYRSHEGPFGKNTVFVSNPLLTLYREWNNGAGSPERVEAFLREMAELSKTQFGPESPQFATQLAILGLNMLELKQWAAAEAATRECLALREKTQPEEWNTFNMKSMLGGALLGQKKYADAEPHLLKGYEGLKAREKTIPPAASTRIPEALDRLLELYTATDKPDEAAKWRAERAKYPNVAPPPRAKK